MVAKEERVAKYKAELNNEPPIKLKLSYHKVWLSGIYYRTYENERVGIEPDFTDLVKK